MPKKPNYGFEKRKKELERSAKQAAKRQRKLDAANRAPGKRPDSELPDEPRP